MSVEYQIIPIAVEGACESMTHDDVVEWVPATHVAVVEITRDVVAEARLCDVCTAGLMAATHSAGG